MKLAIVGSREFENYDQLCAEVERIKETQTIELKDYYGNQEKIS